MLLGAFGWLKQIGGRQSSCRSQSQILFRVYRSRRDQRQALFQNGEEFSRVRGRPAAVAFKQTVFAANADAEIFIDGKPLDLAILTAFSYSSSDCDSDAHLSSRTSSGFTWRS